MTTKCLAVLAILAALATPAAAQPIVSAWPGQGYIQQYDYQQAPIASPPLQGTTFPLGGGITSTQWNGAGPPVTCTTFPLGGGLTTTQCN